MNIEQERVFTLASDNSVSVLGLFLNHRVKTYDINIVDNDLFDLVAHQLLDLVDVGFDDLLDIFLGVRLALSVVK